MNDMRPLPPQPGRPEQPTPYGGPYAAPYGQPTPYEQARHQAGLPPYAGQQQPGPAPYGQAPYGQRPPRKGRGWLAAVGGGLAGAALACAVAIPIAVHTAGADTTSSGGSTGNASSPFADNAEGDGSSPSVDDLIDRGNGTTDATSDGDEPSDAGVLLIDTVLPGGAGAGTAMVLTSDGLALTNYHVVDGSTEVQAIVAATGEEYTAEVVGYDEEADVAVLQLQDADDLDTVTIDDDGGVAIDEAVTALGNASGQGYLSAASGVVTDLDEDITTTDEATGGTTDITGLIETDADVVPGYSGGPMFDDEGEVIGISTAASSSNGQGGGFPMTTPAAQSEGGGISYARPIEEALDVVQLVVDGDEGDGVTIGPAAYLGVAIDSSADGVLVARAESGTPAADAGIAQGDSITAVDGERISSYDDLAAAVATHQPGDEVSVTWTSADGQERTADVTLGESPVN